MPLFLKSKRYIASVITTSTLFFSAHAFAGGFQLWEQDVSGLGDYHAGAAAEGNTAGSEFYNPATMTRIQKAQISFGAALIDLDINYSGVATSTIGTVPVNNASGDTSNVVPNFHLVIPLPRRFTFGFGVTTPFGLSTDYPDVYAVSQLATKTQLETINLNPSLAYRINSHLSLGLGFDELYGKAVYDGNYDLDPWHGSTTNTIYDYTNNLSGWNDGYNAGALIEFNPATRVGLSYRSGITVKASGPSHSNVVPDAFFYPDVGVPINTTANASLSLPPTSIASIYHDFNARFSVMASAFYTQWSVFNKLVLNNIASPAYDIGVHSLTVHEDFRNTWNLALGGKFHINRIYTIEAGFGHDQTPTQDFHRDIRLPDASRYAASLGLNIHPCQNFWWDIGWTHFFMPSVKIDNSLSSDVTATGIGTVTGAINVVGMQLTMNI